MAYAPWVAALRARLGANVMTDDHERHLYRYDATGIRRGLPAAVVHPRDAEDAIFLVTLAAEANFALVPRGSGTGLSGGAVPGEGEVVVSLERLRRVRALDATWRRVEVEAGVVNGALGAHLEPHGLFYPPDPASYQVSSLGGNIAENSGGPHAVKYGITGQHVLALEVVDAKARHGWLRAGELQVGPDLVSLVVGSEGTLALVLAAELSVEPRPEETATLLVSFPALGMATDFVSDVIASGLLPATLEFLDRNTIAAVEEWGVAHYPPGAAAVLLLEVDGEAEAVAEQAQRVEELAHRHGALGVAVARDPEEREGLWLGRRGAFAATARHGRRILTQDVTVPRQRLTEMLQEVERIAARYNLLVATVGHAGDGNLHPDFPYDPSDELLTRRVHEANDEVMRACVRLGGSITGEHGVGIDKLHQLEIMYGPVELGLMAAVKRALDPGLVFNPGKAVPLVPRSQPEGYPSTRPRPESAAELQEAVLAARAAGQALRVSLAAFTGVEVDLPNLTLRVGAGERLATAQEELAATNLHLPLRPLLAQTFAEAVLWNDYGPEHWTKGTVRSWLTASTYVTGYGELVTMGRALVKNVAGYDLFRLLVGSHGRLAVPVSFVFRLAPRTPVQWYRRKLLCGEPVPAEALAGEALFLLPEGDAFTLFASAASAPGSGWTEDPSAEVRLAEASGAARGAPDLLDLGLAPGRLADFLTQLEAPPLLVLPAAARVLLRADEAEARRLVELARAGGPALRALYGPRREQLGKADPLPAAWAAELERVFDPDAVLTAWFPEEETL